MTTADKYDDLAKTAGSAAGLKPEQLPGFAHILRELARSERAEQKEACARVAETIQVVEGEPSPELIAEMQRDVVLTAEAAGNVTAKRIAAAMRAME